MTEPGSVGVDDRVDRLAAGIAGIGPMVVAFSGGVDSALLAHVSLEVLGASDVLAVTARSASLASGEIEHCRDLAASWGLPWSVVETRELARPEYVANGADRCAWCKDELMSALLPLAERMGATVALGVNADDLSDHRPGQHAARKRGARFPLVEAGLTKADIRALARTRMLSVWDRPARPCLASRIPYGTHVTVPILRRVDRAEAAVLALGFSDVRVRHHGTLARVEVPLAEVPRALAMAEELCGHLIGIGYDRVEVDQTGLRSGRLNEALAIGAPQVSPLVAGTGSA